VNRLRQWWQRKRAEATLRRHGVCPKHFVEMAAKYYGYDSGEPIGWTWECPRCNELKATFGAWKVKSELRQAIDNARG